MKKSKNIVLICLVIFAILSVPTAAELSALMREQNQSIEEIRKGDFTVNVTDQDGSPVPGATVEFEMQAHDFVFGQCVNAGRISNQTYTDTCKKYFFQAVDEAAFEWVSCERSRDNVSFSGADHVVNWAKENGLSMRGHALAWGVGGDVPNWQESLSKSALTAEMIERVEDVYDYYGDTTFTDVDVINEMCPGFSNTVANNLDGSFYYENAGWDGVAEMYTRAHELLGGAYVNEYDVLSGGYAWDISHIIDSIEAHGGVVDGIGMQAHTLTTVNMNTSKQVLDYLWNTHQKRVKFTEAIVSGPTGSGGYSDTVQMNALENLMRVGFAHTSVDGILFWGFWQNSLWAPEGCWWTSDWTPRPVVDKYKELVFDEWWSDTSATSGSDGVAVGRVIYGDYKITVTAPGGVESKNVTRTMARSDSAKEITIQLDGEYAGVRPRASNPTAQSGLFVYHNRNDGHYVFNIPSGNSLSSRIFVYNVKGEKVWEKTLRNEYSAEWNYNSGKNISNGTYIVHVENDIQKESKKLIVLR